MEPPGRCGDWLAPPPSPPRAQSSGSTRRARGGDFYLATSGDLHLTISGDFAMAMDTSPAEAPCEWRGRTCPITGVEPGSGWGAGRESEAVVVPIEPCGQHNRR